jgi:hypothetical protein
MKADPQAPRLPTRLRERLAGDPDLDRYVRWSGGAGALVTALWLWLQLDLLDQRVFGNFYDIQGRALLGGHLAVPAGSLGNEAFDVRGHEYLYNPPGPSLLRMPVLLVTHRFDGRLTVASMFLAWVVTVVVLALLVWRVRRLLAPGRPLGHREAALLATFLVVGMAGSTLLYLGSVPWVFHEAYAWAIPMCLGTVHALLGVLRSPSRAGVLATAGFTFGALFSRAPAGFACSLAVLAAAVWLWRGGRGATARGWWLPLGLAALVPLAISVAVNWAKFRHPFSFPIEDQVFTGLSQHRRDAIEANGGDLFGVKLMWSTIPAYLRPDGIHFSSLFPFISLPTEPADAYRGGVFDLTYRTGSVVSFMPLLVLLSALGVVRAFRRRAGEAALLRLPLLGVALVPAGVLVGAYISHRYTSEFVPFLLAAGAVGVVDLAQRLRGWSRDNRTIAMIAVGALAVFGVLANLAVAVQTQALANPGTVLADHVQRQERFSPLLGGDLDDEVTASVDLPEEASADEVVIVGECQAVYVGSGETFTPWVEAGSRPIRLDVTRTSQAITAPTGEIPIAEWEGHQHTTLVLEREGGRYRLALRGGGRDAEGDWIEPGLDEPVTVEVTTDQADDYRLRLTGADDLRVPKESHDVDWAWRPNVLTPLVPTGQPLLAEGVQIDPEDTPLPEGCADRLAAYRERVAPG